MPVKIIDLQSEDAPSPDDLVVIRDNLTGTTRKITRTVFFANPPIGAGAITTDMLADASITKAKLGPDAKIGVKAYTASSPGTLAPDMLNYDVFNVTNLNSGMTVASPVTTTGLLENQGIMFRIRDNGTAQGIGWGSIYRAIGITVPNATVAGKLLYVSGRWNAVDQKIDLLSVGRE